MPLTISSRLGTKRPRETTPSEELTPRKEAKFTKFEDDEEKKAESVAKDLTWTWGDFSANVLLVDPYIIVFVEKKVGERFRKQRKLLRYTIIADEQLSPMFHR